MSHHDNTPHVGWSEKYDKNYDKIFKKLTKSKINATNSNKDMTRVTKSNK